MEKLFKKTNVILTLLLALSIVLTAFTLPFSRFNRKYFDIFGAYGIAVVQAVADVLTMVLAVPIMKGMRRRIAEAAKEQH